MTLNSNMERSSNREVKEATLYLKGTGKGAGTMDLASLNQLAPSSSSSSFKIRQTLSKMTHTLIKAQRSRIRVFCTKGDDGGWLMCLNRVKTLKLGLHSDRSTRRVGASDSSSRFVHPLPNPIPTRRVWPPTRRVPV